MSAVAFVEEFATSKRRCAALQRLFAYRRRLVDAQPLWFTQLVGGALLDGDQDPEHVQAVTFFCAAKGTREEWSRQHPDLFVEAAVKSRFKVVGPVSVTHGPSELFRDLRASSLALPVSVEVAFASTKEEGSARALLDTRRHDVRKKRPLRTAERSGSAGADPLPVAAKPTEIRDDATVVAAGPELESHRPLIAYDTESKLPMHLRPATSERDWMEAAVDRFPARCLPLLIANQSGWELVLDDEVTVTWNGSEKLDGVNVQGSPAMLRAASSHFGLGIVTFHIPYLFRTPPGFNLLVRGPANRTKAGIAPLEGLVETDWTCATFTMNWKILEVGRPIRFAPGDVVALLVPQRRGELESFEPRIIPLRSHPDEASRFALFTQSRVAFNRDLAKGDEVTKDEGWQRYYFQGRDPDGTRAPEHQTRLSLKPFR